MEIEDILKGLGLSEKEVLTYASLLNLGSATATDISDLTRLNRSTIYVVLENLEQKGLLTIHKNEGSITKFSAASLDRLLDLAEESARKYTNLSRQIQNVLHYLKLKYGGKGSKPQVRLLEGTEGLVAAYEETLTSSEPILRYSSINNMHKTLPGYFPDYYKRRAAKNIFTRSIHPNTREAQIRAKFNKEEKRDSVLIPADLYNFSPEISVFDNKIIFISLMEKFALIIESRELSAAFKKIFELSWQEAKRLDQKRKNTRKR